MAPTAMIAQTAKKSILIGGLDLLDPGAAAAGGTRELAASRPLGASALTVIASDSEAIQTKPQLGTLSLDRFALLAMTGSSAMEVTPVGPRRERAHKTAR